MKKCPSCYAIMRESTKATPVPALDGTPAVSAARVRFECSNVATWKSHLLSLLGGLSPGRPHVVAVFVSRGMRRGYTRRLFAQS
jgi:hypothetical protein